MLWKDGSILLKNAKILSEEEIHERFPDEKGFFFYRRAIDYFNQGYDIFYGEYPEEFAKQRAYSTYRFRQKIGLKHLPPPSSKAYYVKKKDIIKTCASLYNCNGRDVCLGSAIYTFEPYVVYWAVKHERYSEVYIR